MKLDCDDTFYKKAIDEFAKKKQRTELVYE